MATTLVLCTCALISVGRSGSERSGSVPGDPQLGCGHARTEVLPASSTCLALLWEDPCGPVRQGRCLETRLRAEEVVGDEHGALCRPLWVGVGLHRVLHTRPLLPDRSPHCPQGCPGSGTKATPESGMPPAPLPLAVRH